MAAVGPHPRAGEAGVVLLDLVQGRLPLGPGEVRVAHDGLDLVGLLPVDRDAVLEAGSRYCGSGGNGGGRGLGVRLSGRGYPGLVPPLRTPRRLEVLDRRSRQSRGVALVELPPLRLTAPRGLDTQDVERERRQLHDLAPLPPRQLHRLALVHTLELFNLLRPVDLRRQPRPVLPVLPQQPPVLPGVLGLELSVPHQERVARLGVRRHAVRRSGEGVHERLGKEPPAPAPDLRTGPPSSLRLERVDDLHDLAGEHPPRSEQPGVVRVLELDDRARQRHGPAGHEHRRVGALDGPVVRVVEEAAAGVHPWAIGGSY